MAFNHGWQDHGVRGKRLIDAPYDAIIARTSEGWQLVVREHVDGGVRVLRTRTFKVLRVAKADALAKIMEMRR